MDKNEYFKTWSEKLSIPVEEIESEFNKVFGEEKTIHPDLSEEQQNKRALQRLALTYKKQLRSPAVGFEGIIIGASDCIDVTARKKTEAKELFNTDPATAVADGITDEEGNVLDNRETWASGKSNPSYGKVLPEHSFLRNIYGIAKKIIGTEEPRLFSMTLNGEKAENENIPIFKPLRFMGIDKSDNDGEYKLNASTFTNFTVDEKIKLPEFKTMLETHLTVTPMTGIEEYHTTNSTDFNRIVLVEGDVSSLNLEPTAFGSRVMNIENPDAALEDLDAKGITCWLPERINVDFAEGSKVLVIGRTAQSKKKDDDGMPTEELGDVTINAFGLYPIPEFKVELPDDIKPVTELETTGAE